MVVRVAGLAYQKGFGGHFHNENSLSIFRDIPSVILAVPANGSDAVQMIILVVSIVVCLGYGFHHIGGWSGFTASVDPSRLKIMDFSKFGFNNDEYGMLPMLLGSFFLYASYYGTDQTQVQRALAAKDLKTVRKTYLMNGIVRFFVTLTYCLMGLIVGAFMLSKPEMVAAIGNRPDRMLPIFMLNYLPNGMMGFVLVGILSAAMSTYSSVFNSLAAVTIEDFWAQGRKIAPKTYVLCSRLASLFWMLVCVVVACFVGDFATTVIEAINKIGSLFYGPILMLFILAILSRRTTTLSANIGLIAGVAMNIYVWKCQPQIFWFWWNVIGAVTTFLVVYLIRFVHIFFVFVLENFSLGFLVPQNIALDDLQKNSLMPFPISRQLFKKLLSFQKYKPFERDVIIWSKPLIGYSLAFFALMILISFLLERIL